MLQYLRRPWHTQAQDLHLQLPVLMHSEIASRFAVYLDRGFWHSLGFGPARASITPARATSCKDDIGGENLDCNCGGRFYFDEGASCWVCENCGRDPSGETV